MPERVTFNEDLGVVVIEWYGCVTIEDLEPSLAATLRISDEEGNNKLFIDAIKMTSFPAVFGIYDFGLQFADSVKNRRILDIAVATSSLLLRDIMFFKTVAQNRGVKINVFDSRDAALEWLTK